jgi:PAS domain S-box-containing protein
MIASAADSAGAAPVGRSVLQRTVSMWTVLWHGLACTVAGACLAAFGDIAWQVLLLTVTGTGAFDPLALVAVLVLGAGIGALIGGTLALAYQFRLHRAGAQHAVHTAVPAGPVSQRPRRRHRLRARLGKDYRWAALSPALCQVMRRTARSLRGRPVFETLHPEDFGVVDRALRRAQESGAPQVVTCRFLVPLDLSFGAFARTTFRSDTQLLPPLDPASFRHVRVRVLPRCDGDGGITHFVCRFRDLSPPVQLQREVQRARHDAAQARRRLSQINGDLRRLKESYRELYQNAPVMYFRLDVNGRLIAFNDTLIRALGHRRAELAGRSYVDLLELVPGRPAALPMGQPPFDEGQVETCWRTRTGAVLDVWIRTVADRDAEGNVVRYRSAAIDLTERNRLAHELRARGDELERTNQRLLAINAELEDFTYVVSHDLKEPLRTLQTYSKRLAEEFSAQLGTDGFEHIYHLNQASQRLWLMIDELLKLSQVGRGTRRMQLFDLIETVATARQNLVDLIQRKEATVLTEGSLPRVVGDRVRIAQLLTNLIANGLKYNQSTQPQVVIAATVRQEPGSPPEVVVSVRDNGIGIDPAYHTKIFGIFRRLHRSDEYEGTGAGLAICKKIVEAHGGHIWVESQPGEGAVFFFTLPEVLAPRNHAAPRSGRLPRPSDETAPRADTPRPRANRVPPATAANADAPAGTHILLVEDDPDAAHSIQRYGRMAGLAYTWFGTAEEAWAFLQHHQPNLLLFDIQLPGIDGIELCRRVRTLAELHETPIVLFVRDSDPDRLAELRTAGADFFLSKDLLVNYADWQQRLQEILDQLRQPLPN